jgi:hypothetical protein
LGWSGTTSSMLTPSGRELKKARELSMIVLLRLGIRIET